MKKTVFALLLCLVLGLCLLPAAYAADIASGTGWHLDSDGCLHLAGAVTNPGTSGGAPWYAQRDKVKTVVAESGASINNGQCLFQGCSNMTSADLRELSTKNVTTMARMFEGCYQLSKLDISGFDSTKVTSMYAMFESCRSLTTLNLSNLKTADVTDMSDMFSNCSSLQSIDLSKQGLYSVEDMSFMFRNCSSLKSVIFNKYTATDNLTIIESMFNGCSSLTSLDLSMFNTANVYDMSNLLLGCSALQSIDISSFDMGRGYNLFSMFEGCTSLTEVGASRIIFANNATDLIRISAEWSDKDSHVRYTTADAIAAIPGRATLVKTVKTGTGWSLDAAGCLHITGAVTNPSTATEDKTPWKDYKAQIMSVATEDGASINNGAYLFYNCGKKTNYNKMTGADLSHLNTTGVTNMTHMFDYSGFPSIDLTGFNTASVTDMSYMFNYCSSLTALDVSMLNTANVTDMSCMFSSSRRLRSLDLSHFNTAKVTNMSQMFHECNALRSLSFGSNFNTQNVTSMQNMFYNCYSLSALDLRQFATGSLNHAGSMFEKCSALASLGINQGLLSKTASQLITISTDWKVGSTAYTTADALKGITGNVTLTRTIANIRNGNGWYIDGARCLHITGAVTNPGTSSDSTPWASSKGYIRSVVVDGTNASINSCAHLFEDCTDLETVDLSGLNTSAVTDMSDMFHYCPCLKSVDLGQIDTSKVVYVSAMFEACSLLESVDLSGLRSAPLTSMNYMFQGCSALKTVDLSGFNTSQVTGMLGMFDSCSQLASVDFGTGFSTASTENVSMMFNGCRSLRSIDLTGFNTGNVTRMEGMFKDCRSLTELDVSGFDVSSLYSGEDKDIFTGCTSLTKLKISGAFLAKTAGQVRGIFSVWAKQEDGTLFTAANANTMTQQTDSRMTLVRAADQDITRDGKLNAADLTALLRHVAKIADLTPTQLYAADVDGNGTVNAKDVTALAQLLQSMAQ